MTVFYLHWEINQTPSGLFQLRAKVESGVNAADGTKPQTLSALSAPLVTSETFPLPWSHSVRLMTVPNRTARQFYEEEAIKGGWFVA